MQKSNTNSINIGINDADREHIAQGLIHFLANTYALYFTTHNFHWNVTGPQFQTLHLLFEQQYTELWTATDVIAERIRALGFFVPQNLLDANPNLGEKNIPNANAMTAAILAGHESLAKMVRELLPAVDNAKDMATADLLTQRLQLHEKTAWMLRSLIAS